VFGVFLWLTLLLHIGVYYMIIVCFVVCVWLELNIEVRVTSVFGLDSVLLAVGSIMDPYCETSE
jgi:hypothetical protein